VFDQTGEGQKIETHYGRGMFRLILTSDLSALGFFSGCNGNDGAIRQTILFILFILFILSKKIKDNAANPARMYPASMNRSSLFFTETTHAVVFTVSDVDRSIGSGKDAVRSG